MSTDDTLKVIRDAILSAAKRWYELCDRLVYDEAEVDDIITMVNNPKIITGAPATDRARYRVASIHHPLPSGCLCGYTSARKRDVTEHIIDSFLEELDWEQENTK